jgi:3-isopropylmalate/(R)-2-methylmalate dehydratase small subunit
VNPASDAVVTAVAGRAVVVPGNDIDTDRIIPARFARALTFDDLGRHAFADDRAEARARGEAHSFDDPRHAGASVLVVGANFGCGSSREHAVAALARAGIRAVVGESFSVIFAGNCTANGIPAVTVAAADLAAVRRAVAADPSRPVTVDVEYPTVAVAGGPSVPAALPHAARTQLVTGRWDALGELLAARDDVLALSARLGTYDLASHPVPLP